MPTNDDLGGELVRDPLWFDDGFTTVPNTWARDPHITHQARGLLVQIASHKAGYRIKLATLMAGALNGRDAIRSMLDELHRQGYLTRTGYREGNLKRYRYRLRDPHAPHGADGQGEFGFPVDNSPKSSGSGFQDTGNPSTGNPSTENPTRIRTLTKEQRDTALEVRTEQRSQPVDKLSAARCVQGHPVVRGMEFCPLGHYTEIELQRRADAERNAQ